MNRVRRESFGKNAAVADLDECIDTVGVQLLAVIPESRVLQRVLRPSRARQAPSSTETVLFPVPPLPMTAKSCTPTVSMHRRCGRTGHGKAFVRAARPAYLLIYCTLLRRMVAFTYDDCIDSP